MKDNIFDLFISRECNFLITEYGFKLIGIQHSHSFGNAVATFESDLLILRIVKDREQYSFEFMGKLDKKNDWYDLDIILLAIEGATKYPSEKRKVNIEDLYDPAKQIQKARKNIAILRTKMSEIINLFKEDKIEESIDKMNKLRNQRAKILFG
ncbi:hypothetical protein [Thermospira aquatica]|uniref:DUF4304 domain-containing protein n=1 Tax=Thermospira aquatica TaxID=2828656 RepID=A0AAX3BAD4_9SPIR|nr:hypothetical protein [Thermospira aquatica]URA09146.1 hypothetical protein KDW03_06450 [Thermospira aquatica]